MRIEHFERTNKYYSVGHVTGENMHFRFVADNQTGAIMRLEQLVDDDWLVVLEGGAPPNIKRLVAAKMADEHWRHTGDQAYVQL